MLGGTAYILGGGTHSNVFTLKHTDHIQPHISSLMFYPTERNMYKIYSYQVVCDNPR
jgi:hypothetical protein